MKYLLDTHIWLWWHLDPKKISKKIINTIAQSSFDGNLALSIISIWELFKLLQKERIRLSLGGLEWVEKAGQALPLEVIPISIPIAWEANNLIPPFHDDPADQILVATARRENCTLISMDKKIQNYKHVNLLR